MKHPITLAYIIIFLGIGFGLALDAAPKAADAPLTAVDVSAYSDGDYILTLKGGTASLRPFRLLTPGNPPAPTPTPTPTPVPGPLSPRAQLFKDAVMKVPPAQDPNIAETSQALVMMYRELALNVRTGKIPDAPTLKAITGGASDLLLKKPSDKATAWQGVRDLLGTQWTILDAKSSPVSAYADLLDDAASGLNATAPNKALSPDMIKLIMQILEIIMKLFGL